MTYSGIKHWFLTGDTHGGIGVINRLSNIKKNYPECAPEETGVIILGDAGLNFYCNKTDTKKKELINSMGYILYCVRGNHEERPENLGYSIVFDEDVEGPVYQDPYVKNIKYFIDGEAYSIDGHSCLVIGGAYSIDKFYRLNQAYKSGWSGWFKDEQLTFKERTSIQEHIKWKYYDFVFTHTCPLSWEPIDLFLHGIDQSQVDKTMEIWMNEIKDTFTWGVWCFGHFHADRIEAPYVEQFYEEYEKIEDVWSRWKKYEQIGELDWWLPLSPSMKKIVDKKEE